MKSRKKMETLHRIKSPNEFRISIASFYKDPRWKSVKKNLLGDDTHLRSDKCALFLLTDFVLAWGPSQQMFKESLTHLGRNNLWKACFSLKYTDDTLIFELIFFMVAGGFARIREACLISKDSHQIRSLMDFDLRTNADDSVTLADTDSYRSW